MAAALSHFLAVVAIVFLAVAAASVQANHHDDKGKDHHDLLHLVEKHSDPTSAVPPPGQTWCIPRSTASEAALQMCIDFACSQGADCGAIKPGGVCCHGNMTQQAAYVMNSYYSKYRPDKNGCDFSGVGRITTVNPSFGSCHFS